MKIYNLKQKITNANLRALLIMALLIVVFTMSEKFDLVSVTFTLTFVGMLFFLFIQFIAHRIRKNEYILILLLFLVIFFSLLASVKGLSSFADLKKYLMFVSTLIYLFIAQKIEVNKKTVDSILFINLLFSIAYILFGYVIKVEYSHIGLTLNFINPNLAAMWIFHSILYLIITLFFYKGISKKMFVLTLIALLTYLMILTRARSVILALIIFILLSLFMWLKRNIRLSKTLIIIILFSPLIFAIFYLVLMNSNILHYFDFLISEGKSLDSREMVWIYALNIFKENPLFGAYNLIGHQMHNTHIDILASYGSIVLIITMIYIIRILLNINKESLSKIQTLAILAFLSVIVLGTFEAALFSGGTGLYLLSISYLILARYKIDENSNNRKMIKENNGIKEPIRNRGGLH